MSVRLERNVYLMLVTLALCATILVASPASAQSQEEGATAQDARSAKSGADATSVVVRPGDSLWSIASERLGPRATSQQINREVERIWVLNRDRIGADPNLIFAGQRLSLLPVGEPSVNQPAAAAPPARGPARADSGGSGEAPGPAAERTTLPDMAAAPPVPTARPMTSDASLPEEGQTWRQLLGWALLALSFGIASVPTLLAARERWRRRVTYGIGEPLTAEAYSANYALFDTLSRDIEEAPESTPIAIVRSSSVSGDGTTSEGNRRVRPLASARRRRMSSRRSRRLRALREGLASGAYNPNVRRHLRGALGAAHAARRRAKE